MEIFGFSEMFHLSNKNIVFAKQQLFYSAPWALSLGWIAFQYFGVSDIALYWVVELQGDKIQGEEVPQEGEQNSDHWKGRIVSPVQVLNDQDL